MTEYADATLNQNGRGLQLYLGVELVHDSAFPLDAKDDVYVHPIGRAGFLVLRQSALQSAYPITIDEPPDPLQEPLEFDASTLNTEPESYE